MARYAQIDVTLADEGRYIGRREEDAVIMIFSLVDMGAREVEASRMRWLTGHTVRCDGSALGRRRVDSVGGTGCPHLLERCAPSVER